MFFNFQKSYLFLIFEIHNDGSHFLRIFHLQGIACVSANSINAVVCVDINQDNPKINWQFDSRNPPYGVTVYDLSLQQPAIPSKYNNT